MWGEGEDSADEVRQAFTDPNVELERDFLVAEDAAGRLAGISVVEDASTDHSLIWLRLALPPQRAADELGDGLLEAAERRAAERVAPGTVMRGGCAAPDEL